MSGRRLAALAAALAAAAAPLAAQDSATVVLGRAYAESRGLLGLGGAGWRALWGAPVRLRVLDAAETDTAGPRARRVLPVDHDPVTRLLPPEARGTSLPAFLRDLVSTLHPTAPLVAASLYGSAGLPVVPRTLGLDARGAAVWVEDAPDRDGGPWGGFDRVVPTDSLDPGSRLDVRAYLAARLLDVVLGDRDRGAAGWLWGHDAARDRWVPVARGQEQAMLRAGRGSRLLLGTYQPGFVEFGAHAPHTRALTARAWDLDRPILAQLDRATWDSVATALAARLDDAAIARAVAAMPAAHRAIAGEEIARALRVRRDALARVVADFYPLMTRVPDLEFTRGADTVLATRDADGGVAIAVVRDGRTEPLRRFGPGESAEVRLHLAGGDDRLVLDGVERPGVGIRVTGGPGLDSVVRGADDVRRVVLYDARDGLAQGPAGDGARVVPHEAGRRARWPGGIAPAPPDFGRRRAPLLVASYNGDVGLLLGAGMEWKWFGFDEPTYRQRARVSLAYATGPSSFRGTAFFERRDVLRGVHLSADLLASGIEVVRFHGIGNETPDTADGSFYRAVHEEYALRLMAGLGSDPDLDIRVGPVVQVQSTDTTGAGTLVSGVNPYGAGAFDVAGLEATLRYQPPRSPFAPGLGVTVFASARWYPAILDATESFGGASAEVDATWVPRLAGRLIVAGRLGGSVLGGRVPFGQAARVGGPRTLRGYAVDRFAGDRGSAYGSLELRSRLARFRLGIAPGDIGVLAFGSGGRVWAAGESSGTIHWAWGGGLWVAPTINWLPGTGGLVARVEAARSTEGTLFYFGTGFRF